MERVLIFGASGIIGTHAAVYLRNRFRVFGTYRFHKPRIDGVPTFRIPINKDTPFLELCKAVKPTVVVYSAGLSETRRFLSDTMNQNFIHCDAPKEWCEQLQKQKIRFIYLSSSKVFAGKDSEYTESALPKPICLYGKAKLKAENSLLRFSNAYVLRLPAIWGLARYGGGSVFNRILSNLWSTKSESYINDEIRNFVHAGEVARVLESIIEHKVTPDIYHVTNHEKLTYFDFARLVAEQFEYPVEKIGAISGAEFSKKLEYAELRGKDLSLKDTKLSALDIQIRSNATVLREIRNKMRTGQQ